MEFIMSECLTISQLVLEIIKCLVDDLDNIEIKEEHGDRTIVLSINVSKSDVGKIIGKKGKIISAIRAICENIAAKNDQRINIHVID